MIEKLGFKHWPQATVRKLAHVPTPPAEANYLLHNDFVRHLRWCGAVSYPYYSTLGVLLK